MGPTKEAKVGIEIGLAVEMKGQRSRAESRDRDRENRSTTRSRPSSNVKTNRDRLICFRCSEYDHLARECPNALTDEESEMSRKTEVRAEESFAMNAAGHTRGELLDGTKYKILIGTGPSKSYMSKSYFMCCRSLHVMPMFTSTTRRIQVGNGQYVLFVILVVIII